MKLINELNKIEDSEAFAELHKSDAPYTLVDAFAFLSIFKVVLTIILSGVKLITGEKTDREIDKFLSFINK